MLRAAVLSLAFLGDCQVAAADDKLTVLVTGATGRTGQLMYKRLKAENKYNVRAFVRNATKAKDLLGCSACDEAEGVFEGDLTKPETLTHVMEGTDVLAIATSSGPTCNGPLGPLSGCTYAKGAEPINIDFKGTKAQVKAFAMASGDIASKRIMYVSTMDTTAPDNFLDRLGHGFVSFYHLQAEVSIMTSGIPYTILKACGLGDGEGGKKSLSVGHDDDTFSFTHMVNRDDVARVLVEAVNEPAASKNLRFDMCANWFGAATTDIKTDIFDKARYPWASKARGAAETETVVV